MLGLLKNIFSDILSLYKNFFHWNISKILIFFWSLILGFLSMLPIILIIFIYWYFSGWDQNELFSSSFWSDWVVNTLLYISKIIFLFFYLYGLLLLIHVSIQYIKGNKLGYSKNYYFDIRRIGKYIKLSLWNLLFFTVPFIFIFLLVSLFVLWVWLEDARNLIILSSSTGESNFFTLITLLFVVLGGLLFLYVFYRVCFSYIIFAEDEKNTLKPFDAIKKSFSLTKSYKILLKFCLFLILLCPLYFIPKYMDIYLENEVSMLNNYLIVKDITPEQEESLKSTPDYNYYQTLVLKYSDLSDEQLSTYSVKMDIYFILFTLIKFFFVSGIFVMFFTSFYRRVVVS